MVMFNKDIGNVYHKHLKETLFQDGATETNLTQLVLKFIETIGLLAPTGALFLMMT